MAEPLSIDNFNSSSILDRSLLAVASDPGAAEVVVQQAQNIPELSFALIGLPGSEEAELRGIESISGTVLHLVDTLVDGYGSLTVVTILQADKYRIYRAVNVTGYVPTDDTFIQFDEIDLATDTPQTRYDDVDGGAGYWYKFTSYNSLTDAETALSDAVAVRGGGVGNYASLDDIRREAGFENAPYLPDAVISMYRRRAQGEIDSKLSGTYIVPFDIVPDAIRTITELLAAGWLLLKEYGELAEGTNKAGGAKLGEGRSWLKQLVDGSATLPDVPTVEIAREEGVDGWPNDSTSSTDPDLGGGDHIFLIGKDF